MNLSKRALAVFASATLLFALVAAADASKIFNDFWLDVYAPKLKEPEEAKEWYKTAKKAKCYVCHIKGKTKKLCNAYGDEMAQYILDKDFKKEMVEEMGEDVAKEKIISAFKKVEPVKTITGETTYGELFESKQLPSEEPGQRSKDLIAAGVTGGEEEDEEGDDEDEDEDE